MLANELYINININKETITKIKQVLRIVEKRGNAHGHGGLENVENSKRKEKSMLWRALV